MVRKMFVATVILALVMFSAISVRADGRPGWIERGNGAFTDGDARVLFTTGSSKGGRTSRLLQMTADTRSRSGMAQIFNEYLELLMQDVAGSAPWNSKPSEERHAGKMVKDIVSGTLSHVQITDRYFDEQSGEFFSLAMLDISDLKEVIKGLPDMEDELKEYIITHADGIHVRLMKKDKQQRGDGQEEGTD